jgi:hypothetical protein
MPDQTLELPPVICMPKTGWLYLGSTGADSKSTFDQSASSLGQQHGQEV